MCVRVFVCVCACVCEAGGREGMGSDTRAWFCSGHVCMQRMHAYRLLVLVIDLNKSICLRRRRKSMSCCTHAQTQTACLVASKHVLLHARTNKNTDRKRVSEKERACTVWQRICVLHSYCSLICRRLCLQVRCFHPPSLQLRSFPRGRNLPSNSSPLSSTHPGPLSHTTIGYVVV